MLCFLLDRIRHQKFKKELEETFKEAKTSQKRANFKKQIRHKCIIFFIIAELSYIYKVQFLRLIFAEIFHSPGN